MLKNIFLIRHGETDFNLKGIIQGGGIDFPLNSVGVEQAELLQPVLEYSKITPQAIYSSPLKRAKQTAEIITKHVQVPILLDPLLKEIDCGDYEGKLLNDLDSFLLENLRNDPNQKYPNGESAEDVRKRAEKFMESIEQKDHKTIMIVSHGNFLRCFMSAVLEIPTIVSMRVFLDNTGFCYLYKSYNVFKISIWNDTSHLREFKWK